jgi:transcriptional regulator GlxA family with amidase domain/uncharacterized GH25 family protein
MHKTILGAAAMLAVVAGVRAHDTWVETNVARIRPGDVVHVDLKLGNHGNDHRDFKLASKLNPEWTQLKHHKPCGCKIDLKPKLADQGLAEKEGYWSAVVRGDKTGRHAIVQSTDRVMKHGTTVRALKSGIAWFAVSDSLDRAESLEPPKPLGLPLELVPAFDPTSIPAGREVSFSLRKNGKPLAGEKVIFVPKGATLKSPEDPNFERITDPDGKVTFTFPEPNLYLVVAHHRAADEKTAEYSATVYGATATIRVGPADAAPKRSDDIKTASEPVRKKVAIVLFPGVELLDFAGPTEVFAGARHRGQPGFDVVTVGLSREPMASLRSLEVVPKETFATVGDPDVIVVPGGAVESLLESKEAMDWLSRQSKRKNALLFSVCNGANAFAKIGLFANREVCTHHANRNILRLLEPGCRVRGDYRFLDHGTLVTAAGISAGTDAALHLVERLLGEPTARETATYLEYDHWFGFGSTRPIKVGEGRALVGREYRPAKRWAIDEILETLDREGVRKAAELLVKLRADSDGHDREMLTAKGLLESAEWVARHGRDPAVVERLLRLVLAADPGDPAASEKLAGLLETSGRRNEAATLRRGSEKRGG